MVRIAHERPRVARFRAPKPIGCARAQAQQQPRAHRALARVVLAHVLPGFEEDIVHEIVGLAPVAEDAHRHAEQRRRQAIVERAEGLAIARTRARDEQGELGSAFALRNHLAGTNHRPDRNTTAGRNDAARRDGAPCSWARRGYQHVLLAPSTLEAPLSRLCAG